MKKYDMKFNYSYDNDAEDEDSVCAESFIEAFESQDEDFGILSFGMEKSEAKRLIETLFESVTEIKEVENVKNELLNITPKCFATMQDVDEILEYAVESEILAFKDGYYTRIN